MEVVAQLGAENQAAGIGNRLVTIRICRTRIVENKTAQAADSRLSRAGASGSF
jgi:hypothetical protein